MMKPIRIETTSANGSKLNLEALYQIAPSCFTEEKDEKTGTVKHVVNFKTLRQLLGDDAVEDSEEMYQFTWPGKQSARREAATPIADTLRPVTEDSVDWDSTQNLYIEGDNLRVLKLLQKSYMGKVKMIYIDPPYNTGNDFVYHDDFKTSLADEELAAGNIDEEGLRYRKNLDGNGRFHSDWCSMMYSRLLVARSLLTEDGVIFISIDDHEVHNLRKICDEVLGAGNFVAELIWKSKSGGSADEKMIVKETEYILLYSKLKDKTILNQITSDTNKYILEDEFVNERGRYLLKKMDFRMTSAHYTESLNYPIKDPNGNDLYPGGESFRQNGGWNWRWSKSKMEWGFQNGFLEFKKNKGKWILNSKQYAKVNNEGTEVSRTTPYRNLIDEASIKTTSGSRYIVSLFESKVFEYPKPMELIIRLLNIASTPGSLILDFFSGSATTAHAVMKLNAEDGGKRKYIMVQYDEKTPEKSEARKAGYKTIPEIAKERIRRAGKKIKEESPLTTQHLDTGFRVFRLDGSNYEDVTKQPGEYDQRTLDLFADNIKADRTDLDLLFGAMLSWGVQLSLSMTTEEVDGCKIYTVDDGGLVACFAENITENVAKAMADKLPVRVLFRDSCFGEDKTKINIFELFKQKLNWDDKEAKENIRVI